jgi:hypothetical protein
MMPLRAILNPDPLKAAGWVGGSFLLLGNVAAANQWVVFACATIVAVAAAWVTASRAITTAQIEAYKRRKQAEREEWLEDERAHRSDVNGKLDEIQKENAALKQLVADITCPFAADGKARCAGADAPVPAAAEPQP